MVTAPNLANGPGVVNTKVSGMNLKFPMSVLVCFMWVGMFCWNVFRQINLATEA